MFRRRAYGLLVIIFIATGCNTLLEMQLPPAVDDRFRSEKVHHRLFHKTGTSVFEYRVKKDSVIYYDQADTLLASGIIVPRMSMTGVRSSRERLFGSDSLQCNLLYTSFDMYVTLESRSLLLDIVFPPEKYKTNYGGAEMPKVVYYYRYFSALCMYNDGKDSARFVYEENRLKKGTDTAVITGRIFYGNDSLVLHPYYLPVSKNEKKANKAYLLEGLGLYWHAQLRAFLQHAPQVEPNREKLHLSNLSGSEEQLLMTAYLILFYDRL